MSDKTDNKEKHRTGCRRFAARLFISILLFAAGFIFYDKITADGDGLDMFFYKAKLFCEKNRQNIIYFIEDKEYENQNKNKDTVIYKYKAVKRRKTGMHPSVIKLNNDEFFIYEKDFAACELYNHKTKIFTLLNKEFKAAVYFKKDENTLLLIDKNYIKEFDIKNKSLNKASDGIPEMREREHYAVMPYSEEYIYICVLEPQQYIGKKIGGYKYIVKSLIKLNLKNYEYEIKNVSDSPEFVSWSVINNKELFLITYPISVKYNGQSISYFDDDKNEAGIYTYNAEQNEFYNKGVYNIPLGSFYTAVLNNNRLLLIKRKIENGSCCETYYYDAYLLNLKDFQIEHSFNLHLSSGFDTNAAPAVIRNKAVFTNGIIYDSDSKIVYNPLPLNRVYRPACAGLIYPLNDTEFIRLGWNCPAALFRPQDSIIKLKKLTAS